MTRINPFLKTVLVLLQLLFVHAAYGDNNSKLLKAAIAGHAAQVERLLTKGADVEARDQDGMTALMTAESKGHTEVVRILKQAGEDTNQENTRSRE